MTLGLNFISTMSGKIGIRDRYDIDIVYSRLWLLFLKQGKVMEALVSAEQGRAMSL